MTLENKLGITDSLELAKAEEKISKKRQLYLFDSIYDFAGKSFGYGTQSC